MLRGLDADAAARSDHQPPLVRVADRAPLPVTVTLYGHERPTADCQRRFERVLSHLELLEDAGLVRGVRAVAWPARVEDPRGQGAVTALVESFVEAAGARAVAPFFDRGPDGVSVPGLAVVLRRDGTITDLYPRRTADGALWVGDGLERLVAGEALEGLAGEAVGSVTAAGSAAEPGAASESDRSDGAVVRSRTDSRSDRDPGGDAGDADAPPRARRESDGEPLTPP